MMAGAVVLPVSQALAQTKPAEISLVLAPSNLGLRQLSDSQPGTWRAPQVLMDAGLADALHATEVVSLDRPTYQLSAQAGTRIRNGQSIRAFSLLLSEKIRGIVQAQRFPVVIGGDCSVLLGSLHGMRLAGGRGLVHVDGHSDFYHPDNYNSKNVLGAAAGMDLALASGRGEALLTDWPEVGHPLANDADIVQVGDRDASAFTRQRDRIPHTEITQFTVQRVLAEGVEPVARQVISILKERRLDRAWLHVDLDVLDEDVMPAVDSPGSPGFTYVQLAGLVHALCASGRIAGANFGIYDPDRDPKARHARDLVHCIANGVRS